MQCVLLQLIVAMDSTEAKYVPLSEAAEIFTYFQNLLNELDVHQRYTAVYQDTSEVIEYHNEGSLNYFLCRKHLNVKHKKGTKMILKKKLS